jgi:hypothetical protein
MLVVYVARSGSVPLPRAFNPGAPRYRSIGDLTRGRPTGRILGGHDFDTHSSDEAAPTPHLEMP